MREPLLRASNLSKRFGMLAALQGVSLEIAPGEVVGLAGRSGSGKSVLAMLLASHYKPDEGSLTFAGQRLLWPFPARKLGIELIHQQPNLVDELDISSNIFLGNDLCRPGLLRLLRIPDRRRMDQRSSEILAHLDLRFASLREKVGNLSSEQRQLIAIARALTSKARLMIVDDPSTLLSYSFQKRLLTLIQEWQQQGVAVVFSSNNLDDLFAVTDRILVLSQGELVASLRTDQSSREEVVNALVGNTDRQQLTPIMWALDSYYRARAQAEQLYHQQTLLEQDLEAQGSLNQQLVDQLGRQVRALDSANFALQDAHRRLLTEREQERKHLARELHDEVIQDLLSINYQLEEIETSSELNEEVGAELEDIRTSIRELVTDLRGICGNLRPPTIDSLGLGAALQSYIQDWMARTGVNVRLNLDPNLGRLPETIELSLFRIVQEGLSNVRKHARASAVQVTVAHTSLRSLMVSIVDNGRGLESSFDLAACAALGHYGLLGISERVALLGGHLSIQSQRRGGVLLRVEIPHPRVENV